MQLSGHNAHRYIWRKKGEARKSDNTILKVKYGGGSIMLWGCLNTGGTGALQTIDGTMRKQQNAEILKQHQDIRQEVKAWVQMVLPNGQ